LTRESVTAPGAPAPVGPYVHAIRAGELLFCSGQVGLDPKSGELAGITASEQTGRCLENLAAVCDAAGTTLGHAVRLTVYLTEDDRAAAAACTKHSWNEHEKTGWQVRAFGVGSRVSAHRVACARASRVRGVPRAGNPSLQRSLRLRSLPMPGAH